MFEISPDHARALFCPMTSEPCTGQLCMAWRWSRPTSADPGPGFCLVFGGDPPAPAFPPMAFTFVRPAAPPVTTAQARAPYLAPCPFCGGGVAIETGKMKPEAYCLDTASCSCVMLTLTDAGADTLADRWNHRRPSADADHCPFCGDLAAVGVCRDTGFAMMVCNNFYRCGASMRSNIFIGGGDPTRPVVLAEMKRKWSRRAPFRKPSVTETGDAA